MTNDEVHSAVVRWICARTNGVKTIKSHEGGKTYHVYNMVNFTGAEELRRWHRKIEFTETDDLNSAGEKIIEAAPVIDMEWRFSVHAYGENPTDRLRPILSAIKLPQVMEPLLPGLLVHSASQIRNVPDWINEKWQPRAQMDLFVRGVTRDAHVLDVIDEYSFDIRPAG